MNEFAPGPSLPVAPALVGGARTRSQTSGDKQTREALRAISRFSHQKQGHAGRQVSTRTTAAVHRFAEVYGKTIATVENLGEHIRDMRRGGHSREVQMLLRDQRRESKKLAKLNRWYSKHIKPRFKKGGERFREVLNTAIASSASFLGAVRAYLPSINFRVFYSKLKSFFSGHPAATKASPASPARSGRSRSPPARYNPSTGRSYG